MKIWTRTLALAALAVLSFACTDAGVAPEAPEEAASEASAPDGAAAFAGVASFPDPANDPRCQYVGRKGGAAEYICETRTTPLIQSNEETIVICRYRVRL